MWRSRIRRDASDGLPELHTARLRIRCPLPSEAPRLVAYYEENRAHLAQWEPIRAASFYQPSFWERELRECLRAYRQRRGIRWIIEAHPDSDLPFDSPPTILGVVRYSNLQHGVCQSGTLGYSLAADAVGRGLMFEALQATNEFCFEHFGLHRIEANYMPRNIRSGRLLVRLGFREEGLARRLLQIAGQWEDHVRTALLSDDPRPHPETA